MRLVGFYYKNTKYAVVLILIYSTCTLHFNGSTLPQKLQRLVQYVYVIYKIHFIQCSISASVTNKC